MALRAIQFYTDMIIDSIVVYNIVIALGGLGLIFENITSFQSLLDWPRLRSALPWALLKRSALLWLAQILS